MIDFGTVAFVGALTMAGAFLVVLYKINQASNEM